jgi:hypothetical protein
MPGVVDIPQGAWFDLIPMAGSGGYANVLTSDQVSPGGSVPTIRSSSRSGKLEGKMQIGFYFDQTRCTGCLTASWFKDAHDIAPGPASWRRVTK